MAVYLAAEILRGLDFAHRLPFETGMRGIVHRDVSPKNILLSWFGGVKWRTSRLFQGPHAKAVLTRVILSDVRPPSSVRPIAPDLKQVVMRLLAKDRDAPASWWPT